MAASLEDSQRERLRGALHRWSQRFPDPERAQSEMARTLRVSPSALSRLMGQPSTGGSLKLIYKVAEALNEPPELILNGDTKAAPIRKLRELPGFAEEFAEARRRAARLHLTMKELEDAADVRAEPEPTVTADLLIALAVSMRTPINPPPAKSRTKQKS